MDIYKVQTIGTSSGVNVTFYEFRHDNKIK